MYELIPDELKSLKTWGLYKLIWKPERKKYTKIPIDPYTGRDGKSNDPSTWTDFKTALQAMQDLGMDGLGFYFQPPYIGIDVDHIGIDLDQWKTGDKANAVQAFMNLTHSYMETSVSGEGIHIIVKGEIPGTRRRKANVEM
ncbi:DNA primase, partial [Secundilactobacillus sp. HBUAS58055]|nr:DNA primase [Secundilactobacillus angelensis]